MPSGTWTPWKRATSSLRFRLSYWGAANPLIAAVSAHRAVWGGRAAPWCASVNALTCRVGVRRRAAAAVRLSIRLWRRGRRTVRDSGVMRYDSSTISSRWIAYLGSIRAELASRAGTRVRGHDAVPTCYDGDEGARPTKLTRLLTWRDRANVG